MGRIIIGVILVDLALVVAAIADCLGGEHPPRRYSRGLWVAAILLLPIAGPIAWFTAGRHQPHNRPRPSSRPSSRPTVAPDDDPEFLRDLERRLREDKDES